MLSFLLFLIAFTAVIAAGYWVIRSFREVNAPPQVGGIIPPPVHVPRSLRPFEKFISERGYEPQMIEHELVFPFPVRGAFPPGDEAHMPGVVCSASMMVVRKGEVVVRVWLPRARPA